jgi:phospholipid N-methyltransferase
VSVVSFFKQWLQDPITMGSVTPSSRFLARRMVHGLELGRPAVVVELGAGTGAFTAELARRLHPEGKLILVERSPELAEQLRERFPRAVVINDCASSLGTHLKAMGIGEVDYIVSGLPWTMFSQDLQDRALAEIRQNLKPGGVFVTFLYIHGKIFLDRGVRFERKVRQHLGRVDKSQPVWRNFPPARVWTWQRPVS